MYAQMEISYLLHNYELGNNHNKQSPKLSQFLHNCTYKVVYNNK